jgi:NAD(P)-dependent dehydrogenase (short-subunit alcohol dehydrogenase family)
MDSRDKRAVVVTGANIGLGLALTRGLATQDCRVIMACRSVEKADLARDTLLAELPGAELDTAQLDLSSVNSVAAFAAGFRENYGELDLLINNAGITGMPLQRNDRGHELHLATNYLGPFALTGLLLPHFRAGVRTRIVNVNSLAHKSKGAENIGDLNWERDQYEPMRAYGRSKFALMMYTLELQRRLQQAGSQVIAVSSHPGFAATDILSKPGSAMAPKNLLGKLRQELFRPLIPTPEKAARSTLLAALGEDVEGGHYYGPTGLFEIAGKPGPAKINPAASNKEAAQDLWKMSEQMTNVSYLNSTG